MEWVAESLRVSLFYSRPYAISDSDWKQITGEGEAEITQKLLGQRKMSGPFLSGQLNLASSGTRTDCILTPKVPEELEEGYCPSLGGWSVVLNQFVERTCGWVVSAEVPVVRMALGATLLGRCSDRREAYQSLGGLLKSIQVDPDRMRELLYRVNWPVQSSTVKGLLLNRIVNWSVIGVQAVQMLVAEGSKVPIGTTSPTFFVRLEMDHNTDGERIAPLDQISLGSVYKELVDLAVQNANEGELL